MSDQRQKAPFGEVELQGGRLHMEIRQGEEGIIVRVRTDMSDQRQKAPFGEVELQGGRLHMEIRQGEEGIIVTPEQALELAEALRTWGTNPLGLQEARDE